MTEKPAEPAEDDVIVYEYHDAPRRTEYDVAAKNGLPMQYYGTDRAKAYDAARAFAERLKRDLWVTRGGPLQARERTGPRKERIGVYRPAKTPSSEK